MVTDEPEAEAENGSDSVYDGDRCDSGNRQHRSCGTGDSDDYGPELRGGRQRLAQIYRWTGFQKPGYFTALILVLIILGFVLKNVFLYFQNVVQLRFVYRNQFETSHDI